MYNIELKQSNNGVYCSIDLLNEEVTNTLFDFLLNILCK